MLLDKEEFMVVSRFDSMSVVVESDVERPFRLSNILF